MIANVLPQGKAFKGLIRYNVEGHLNEKNPHKAAWLETRNLASNDPEVVWRIMAATADLSTRVQKPVFHFSVDWHPNEEIKLNREVATQAADKILKNAGLEGHQVMMFYHSPDDDEKLEHPHLHVVVNRVHPQTGKAWETWKCKERMERSVAEISREMGFEVVPGRHNELERENKPTQRKDRGDYYQSERLETEDLKPWLKTDVNKLRDGTRDYFKNSKSWDELSTNLNDHGLELRTKGQGLIITDGRSFAKLSDMGKSIRLPSLEKSFGQSWQSFNLEKKSGEKLRDLANTQDYVNYSQRITQDASKKREETYLQSRAKNRSEWLHKKAGESVQYHEAKLQEILKTTYRNHGVARKRLDHYSKEQRLDELATHRKKKQARWRVWVDILKGKAPVQLDAKKGIKILNFKSAARKKSEQHEKYIAQRYQKLREAKSRLESRNIDAAISAGRSRQADRFYKRAKKRLDEHSKKRRSIYAQRHKLIREISEKEIWKSPMPEEMKFELAALWQEQNIRDGVRQAEYESHRPDYKRPGALRKSKATVERERKSFTDALDRNLERTREREREPERDDEE